MQAFLEAAEGFEPSTFCMASRRRVCRGPAKCLQTNDFREARPPAGFPRIVRRYRGFRQGTDNERSRALGGSAGSHVAVESAPVSTVREPDSCCSSGEGPAELTWLPIEGAAQLLLVHRSSSDERADSAPADTCFSSLCRSGSGAYRDTRFHGDAARFYARSRRESQPPSAPSTSPISGASGRSVCDLMRGESRSGRAPKQSMLCPGNRRARVILTRRKLRTNRRAVARI